ncbi:MAG TPA: SDR family oxidoreductase [Dehalococcoidia bacterium]|nr:SDR family oxidoreductase [Dehalococcoidia bacterium]
MSRLSFFSHNGHATDRRVVVITGASAGVGRACARMFAEDGADVGLLARDQDRLEAAKREVEARGGRASIYPADVSDAAAVEEAARHFEQELGPIDVWVNNAMTSVFSPAKEMQPDEYRRVTEVSYLGYVYGTLAALHRMLPRDRGTIVQVGSALAYRGIPLQSAYCGAKHAIQGFTESVRSELYHDDSKVWITMVQMPALNTPQFGWVKSRLPRKAQPVPPIYQPEVAASAVVWASKHRRRELVAGSSAAKAIIGDKVMPGVLDHVLGSSGYESQQYDGARDPDRPDNLWETVPGDFAAHGDFDARAKPHSKLLWLDMHRNQLAVAASGAALAGLTAMLPRRASTDDAR